MIYPWQHTQWQLFTQLKSQQRLPHAMLITGDPGLGKLSFAKQLTASVLCATANKAEPCGQCHSCQLFKADNHPDHTLIEPEEAGKQIKIDQIRQLKNKQALTPTVSQWKTVIVYPADSMNISAYNSLLKLLEEPQQNTLLLLLTAKPDTLPITITSRCQSMVFSAPSIDTAYEFVKQLKTDVDSQTLNRVMALAKGAPLKALSLLDSDIIEQTKQVERDFKSIIDRQANPVTLAKQWQTYDLVLCLNHLQVLIQKRVIIEQEKDNSLQLDHYWYIYDCITQAIKLISLSNNINKVLLIEQFMVSVMKQNWNNSLTANEQ